MKQTIWSYTTHIIYNILHEGTSFQHVCTCTITNLLIKSIHVKHSYQYTIKCASSGASSAFMLNDVLTDDEALQRVSGCAVLNQAGPVTGGTIFTVL